MVYDALVWLNVRLSGGCPPGKFLPVIRAKSSSAVLNWGALPGSVEKSYAVLFDEGESRVYAPAPGRSKPMPVTLVPSSAPPEVLVKLN